MDGQDAQIRVLIVEDDEDIRALLKLNLEAHPGFALAGEAPDGTEAAELLREAEPDVVIMDLDMPKLDGLGAIRSIRRVQPDAKVVVFSARYDRYDANDLLEERANLYIDKSQSVTHLLQQIEALVRESA